jgi:hypothetical protein
MLNSSQAGSSNADSTQDSIFQAGNPKAKAKSDPKRNSRTYGFFTRLNSTTFKDSIQNNPKMGSGGNPLRKQRFSIRLLTNNSPQHHHIHYTFSSTYPHTIPHSHPPTTQLTRPRTEKLEISHSPSHSARVGSGSSDYEDPLALLDENIIDETDSTKPGAVFLPSSPALLEYICSSAKVLSGELKRLTGNKVGLAHPPPPP